MIQIISGGDTRSFIERFESRRSDVSDTVVQAVSDILKAVKERGDVALTEFASRFDGTDIDRLGARVDPDELERAHADLDPDLLAAIRQARDNIRRYHEKSLPQSWMSWEEDGVILGQRIMPLQRVGVYVPGGLAAYPSSLLMGVVPAQVAGVNEVVITTPSDREGGVNSTILATAREVGIDTVYRYGGAHGIAGLAFGTETICRVDKIVGPGNIYVATAKKLLYGQVGIDMVAGPSEVVIIADANAEPDYVAADLLAQAEHDELASSILITHSLQLAESVRDAVVDQVSRQPRKEIITKSLQHFGGILVTDSLDQSVELCNWLAPEHLGLYLQDAWELLGRLNTAGAIFIGSYSPETVGDYWAGPNHVLPTNGSGRFFSPLRTEDFLKASSIVSYTRAAMEKDGDKMIRFAHAEGLNAHADAIRLRLESSGDRN